MWWYRAIPKYTRLCEVNWLLFWMNFGVLKLAHKSMRYFFYVEKLVRVELLLAVMQSAR